MQQFIGEIADYARQTNPNFIVIPQNGLELAYNDADTSLGLNSSFLSKIDGFGVEGLFYGETESPDAYRIAMAKQIRLSESILVADYLSNDNDYNSAVSASLNESFICFPRLSGNYDYTDIPNAPIQENTNNITSLADAKNYLYLISTQKFTSKQAYLQAIAATNYDLVIVDLFFEDEVLTSSDIASLKTKANGSTRKVVAYMSIGSAEKYRYYWKKSWSLHCPSWIKKKYDGYPDEFWVKYWHKDWKKIIFGNDDSYTKKILNAGFDGVYLDNVEAYYFLYFKN